MEYTFRTARNEIAQLSDALVWIATITAVDAASLVDMQHIASREDTLIEDAVLRESVIKHSPRLGLLVRAVEDVATHYGVCKEGELLKAHDGWWRARLRGETGVTGDHITHLARVASAMRDARGVLVTREGEDSGSSSPSDYSDSETDSSDGEEEEEEDDGEEEEDDDDPPPRRVRLR